MQKIIILFLLGSYFLAAASSGMYTNKERVKIQKCLKHIKPGTKPELKKYLLSFEVGSFTSDSTLSSYFISSCLLNGKPLYLDDGTFILNQSNDKSYLKSVEKKYLLNKDIPKVNILSKKKLLSPLIKNMNYKNIVDELSFSLNKDFKNRGKNIIIQSKIEKIRVEQTIKYLTTLDGSKKPSFSKYQLKAKVGIFTRKSTLKKFVFISALSGGKPLYLDDGTFILNQSNNKSYLKKLEKEYLLAYKLNSNIYTKSNELKQKANFDYLPYSTFLQEQLDKVKLKKKRTYTKKKSKRKKLKKKKVKLKKKHTYIKKKSKRKKLKKKKVRLKKKRTYTKKKSKRKVQVKHTRKVKTKPKPLEEVKVDTLEKELDLMIDNAASTQSSLDKTNQLKYY